MVDDDVELEREPAVGLADADAGVVLAREQPHRPAPPPRLVDDAERLLDRATGDGRDRPRRHGHATVFGLAQEDRALLHGASLCGRPIASG